MMELRSTETNDIKYLFVAKSSFCAGVPIRLRDLRITIVTARKENYIALFTANVIEFSIQLKN